MRLLIISQYFHPEAFRINDLVNELTARGHQVTVLTGMPNYPSGKLFHGYRITGPWTENIGSATVKRVPLVLRGNGKGPRLLLNYLSFAAAASILGPFRCRGPFDGIFVFEPSPITVGIPATVMKWITKAPITFWVQDLWPEILIGLEVIQSERVVGWVRRLARWIYERCDRILVPSQAFAPPIQSLGIQSTKIEYVPNWAEALYRPTVVADSTERKELPDGFCILFGGAIGESQGFETLIDAAERLRDHADIQWVVIGDGRRLGWLKSEIQERRLSSTVHLLGPRPVEAMPRYFALADALLILLRNDPIYRMTIPSKLQSYFACGKPVLASLDGEGARIIAEARAGIVAKAESGEELAAQATALWKRDPEELKRMGEDGRAYFLEHFERNMVITGIENLMKELSPTRTTAGSG